MDSSRILIAAAAAALFSIPLAAQDGFTDTAMLPGQKWHVHDKYRPHPPKVDPGPAPARPTPAPSDAIVLFDGKDFSHWTQRGRGADRGKTLAPKWKIANGAIETVGKTGDLVSKEKFGDAQYHIEWQIPAGVTGEGQARGNSGVLIMSHYEIQVLESHTNETYADGQAGAIYGQWPPRVNPARKQGEWQSYDIVFEAPRFEGEKVVKPAYVTVFMNGILLHNRQEIIGAVVYKQVAKYRPHAAEEPLSLQDHDMTVRYRNIWVRPIKGYDQK
jgi:hypothetical protein